MNICIFCLTKAAKLTDEHVFPAALGGEITLKSSSCSRCNHSGSKFEQPLLNELAPCRALFRITDRYGHVPEVEVTAETENKDYAGRLKNDGSVQLKRTVTQVNNADGTKEFVHRFLNPRQREKLMKEVREKKLRFDELGPGDPVRAEIHVGGNCNEIGSSNGLRTVAKIAYVGLAYFAGIAFATGESFQQVRKFIMKGTSENVARLFVNKQFVGSSRQGPHQHSLILAGCHDKRRVAAIVRLFGGICYFVSLSERYAGADFNKTIVYDGFRREENDILVTHVDTEIRQIEAVTTSSETIWDDLPAACESFAEFLRHTVPDLSRREVPIR
jgi:hypothetical protein